MVKSVSFGWGCVLLGISPTVIAADPPVVSAVPERLAASVQGFTGPSYSIELKPGGLVIYLSNPKGFLNDAATKRAKFYPDASRWASFRAEMDRAKVWNWKKAYTDSSVLDGTSWTFSAKYGKTEIDSKGRNDYPDAGEFKVVCAAVSKLIGGKPFR